MLCVSRTDDICEPVCCYVYDQAQTPKADFFLTTSRDKTGHKNCVLQNFKAAAAREWESKNTKLNGEHKRMSQSDKSCR